MNKLLVCFSFLGMFSLHVLAQNATDAQGRKQGPWSKFYPGKKIYMYKGQFLDDIPTGTFTYYDETGKVKAVIKHGEKALRSEAVYYNEKGKVISRGIFRNQKKDSIWVNYTSLGEISFTESYKNGVLDGPSIVYYLPETAGGKVQPVSSITNYLNGLVHGDYIEYFNTGEFEVKGKYLNGEKDGVWEAYHTNGKVMSQDRYKKGVRHGYQYAFDPAGKKVGEKYYYQGKLLTGKALTAKLAELKKKGIDPNQ
jgi:antitoxin component YwqK of YwqJK toxin-antitoxin module